ncbi:MAG TPA: sigma-70 family RNA polymerase sigma factor [Firmicutes bacterium]|nr:sigma-70 family RNA polymerase sigma factor [Bacillota bacterium]
MGAYLDDPSADSLARVVEAGRKLVYHFAHLYCPGRPGEDVIQVGFEGLLKAARRFDRGRGVAFATYAGHCIIGEIRHYLRREASFRRPRWLGDLQARVDRTVEETLQRTGQLPTVTEVDRAVNVREAGLVEAMRAQWVSPDEIDVSKIQHLRYVSFHLPVEDRIALEEALEQLSDLQRKVVLMLFYRDLTQAQTAKALGISQRKVSRILQSSLRQMAAALA